MWKLILSYILLMLEYNIVLATATLPVFNNPRGGNGTVTITEGPAGRNVTMVNATITTNTAIVYALDSQTSGNPVPFTVASNGLVKTSAGIDYEQIQSKKYVMKITATSSQNTATATLTISITNVSDNTPVFGRKFYCVAVLSNATQGTRVGLYTATDADQTPKLTYGIKSGDDTPPKFHMAQDTGEMTTTAQAFEKTTKVNYTLVINASDGTNTGSATVYVLLDGNCPVQQEDNNKNDTGNSASVTAVTIAVAFLAVISQLM